jgi:DNA invertase Pin-like site-specific DNA recombinase
MRGVIYARCSSDNQREESIEGQIREDTAYAQKNGIDKPVRISKNDSIQCWATLLI